MFRFFANDFSRAFVFAETEEGRLAEVIVASPFGEPNLANEFGFKPGATAHLGSREPLADGTLLGKIRERTIGTEQLLEFVME
jgi:hypothetical protein